MIRFLVILLISCASALAASVELAWDPNTEEDMAGYRIWQAISSGAYITPAVADVEHPTTNATVTGLVSRRTYYFVATAYNTSDLESGYSNEVTYTVPGDNRIIVATRVRVGTIRVRASE
jgi:hypothetical protein